MSTQSIPGQPPSELAETASLSETRMTEVVFPEHSNHYGTLFAGNALSLMAKAAFVAGARHAGQNVVMATAEKVDFLEPVQVGEVIQIVARIERSGNSSMTVGVEIVREGLSGEKRSVAVRGKFAMVAINKDGRPVRIEPKDSK